MAKGRLEVAKAVERESGRFYYLDKGGNVRSAPMKHGKKKRGKKR